MEINPVVIDFDINVNPVVIDFDINVNPVPMKGDRGETGEQGLRGDRGETGEQGLSAYEVASANGFEGTEQEWLESIKGDLYGNIDGGKANSNYGGIFMIFGGNSGDF